MSEPGDRFRSAFGGALRGGASASALKAAALDARLVDWTTALTAMVVETCASAGWIPCAKGHAGTALPEGRHEYLTLDLTAFSSERTGWRLPEAAIELENSRSVRRIAYCLWKLLAGNARIRVLFCYRSEITECSALLGELKKTLLQSLSFEELRSISGDTYLCIGTRGDAETFPAGFFRWWRINPNTTNFEAI